MKMIIRSGCMRMRNRMTGECSTFFNMFNLRLYNKKALKKYKKESKYMYIQKKLKKKLRKTTL